MGDVLPDTRLPHRVARVRNGGQPDALVRGFPLHRPLRGAEAFDRTDVKGRRERARGEEQAYVGAQGRQSVSGAVLATLANKRKCFASEGLIYSAVAKGPRKNLGVELVLP